MRPVDISRKFGISTTTIRKYEQSGLTPPVLRTKSGYRVYTEEHAAYIACAREMMPAFTQIEIAKIYTFVMERDIDAALWTANKKQADLYHEKIIAGKIAVSLLEEETEKKKAGGSLTIHEISRETGVPVTTIRYWDNIGLITAERLKENGYRIFHAVHIRQILTIYALKLAVYANHQHYSMEQTREALKTFDYSDKNRIASIVAAIERHLSELNRDQMKALSALFLLCKQVEAGQFYLGGPETEPKR